jgi:hypothetical protein
MDTAAVAAQAAIDSARSPEAFTNALKLMTDVVIKASDRFSFQWINAATRSANNQPFLAQRIGGLVAYWLNKVFPTVLGVVPLIPQHETAGTALQTFLDLARQGSPDLVKVYYSISRSHITTITGILSMICLTSFRLAKVVARPFVTLWKTPVNAEDLGQVVMIAPALMTLMYTAEREALVAAASVKKIEDALLPSLSSMIGFGISLVLGICNPYTFVRWVAPIVASFKRSNTLAVEGVPDQQKLLQDRVEQSEVEIENLKKQLKEAKPNQVIEINDQISRRRTQLRTQVKLLQLRDQTPLMITVGRSQHRPTQRIYDPNAK